VKGFKDGMKDATATDKPADAEPPQQVGGQTIDVEVKEKTKS
jgi:sec-independent protein translocase protein TatA